MVLHTYVQYVYIPLTVHIINISNPLILEGVVMLVEIVIGVSVVETVTLFTGGGS